MKLFSQRLWRKKNENIAIENDICGWKEDIEVSGTMRLFKKLYYTLLIKLFKVFRKIKTNFSVDEVEEEFSILSTFFINNYKHLIDKLYHFLNQSLKFLFKILDSIIILTSMMNNH